MATALEELQGSPVVIVVAPSGAGKSSLVRAGILPRVRAGVLGGGAWRTAALVPGTRPTERLTHALAAAAPEMRHDRLLVFVDQLEELWTLSPADERTRFVDALAALVLGAPGTRLIATLRTDFLANIGDLGDLKAPGLRALVTLGPMTPGGLRRAITEPARRRGVTVEAALVDRLVESAGSESLPLPRIRARSDRAKRDATKGAISLAELEAIGGLDGALAAHADATLAQLPGETRLEARRILLALVTVKHTRARRGEEVLVRDSSQARAALGALVEARLVVASAGEQGAEYEVAHEALVTGWPSLRRRGSPRRTASSEIAERVERAAADNGERLGRAPDALLGVALPASSRRSRRGGSRRARRHSSPRVGRRSRRREGVAWPRGSPCPSSSPRPPRRRGSCRSSTTAPSWPARSTSARAAYEKSGRPRTSRR